MTIHEIVVRGNDETTTKTEPLDPGDLHYIKFGGLNVPITVHGDDSVTIHIGAVAGKLDNLDVLGFGDDQEWTKEAILKIKEVTVCPEAGESAVTLFAQGSEDTGSYKVIMRAEKPVTLGMRANEIA